jgi:hypothetical protein
VDEQDREDYSDYDRPHLTRHQLIGKVVSVAVGLVFLAALCGCPLLACLFR